MFRGGGLDLFQDFQALFIKALLVEDSGKIELFPDLYTDILVNRIQAQADEDLFVEVRLEVGQLGFFDNATLQDGLFVIGFVLVQ